MNKLKPAHQAFGPGVWTFASRVMKPVIRIFLRLGFSAEQISQLVRKLAVDAAMEHPEFRPARRKRAFIAHAAVVTGLSRKEVSKLHAIEELSEVMDTRQVDRSVRVLAGWINDARYGDPSTGRPLARLPLKAAAGVSFHQLAREYAGDVPPRSVLDALIERGAASRDGNFVQLVQEYPTQAGDKNEELDFIGIMLQDALGTAEYDLRPDITPRLFREWYQQYVPSGQVPEAQAMIREETVLFGRRVEQRLAALAHRSPKAHTQYRRVGVGAYYFQGDEEDGAE